MKKFKFTKMVASGNDFALINSLQLTAYSLQLKALAKNLCDRKFGVGADGLLVLEKSKAADIRMRIFNADGSEAEMCGNGARCAALYASSMLHAPRRPMLKIETKAGIIQACVNQESVKIKLTDPQGLKLNIPLKINGRLLRANFINTGVPHTVIFVEGLDKIGVADLGRKIRFHPKFAPAGTNVNFAEVLGRNAIKIRTYERGVEDETLACGTGSVASALISVLCSLPSVLCCVNVKTQGGEILKVYYSRCGDKFQDVWLEGKAQIVYKGEYRCQMRPKLMERKRT